MLKAKTHLDVALFRWQATDRVVVVYGPGWARRWVSIGEEALIRYHAFFLHALQMYEDALNAQRPAQIG